MAGVRLCETRAQAIAARSQCGYTACNNNRILGVEGPGKVEFCAGRAARGIWLTSSTKVRSPRLHQISCEGIKLPGRTRICTCNKRDVDVVHIWCNQSRWYTMQTWNGAPRGFGSGRQTGPPHTSSATSDTRWRPRLVLGIWLHATTLVSTDGIRRGNTTGMLQGAACISGVRMMCRSPTRHPKARVGLQAGKASIPRAYCARIGRPPTRWKDIEQQRCQGTMQPPPAGGGGDGLGPIKQRVREKSRRVRRQGMNQ